MGVVECILSVRHSSPWSQILMQQLPVLRSTRLYLNVGISTQNSTFSYYYPYVYNRNSRSTRTRVPTSCMHTIHQLIYFGCMQILRWQLCPIKVWILQRQLKFYARTTSVGRPGVVIIGLTDAAGTLVH